MGGRQTDPYHTYESRYAPYIESAHDSMLKVAYANVLLAIDDNPYYGYTDVDVDEGFFGLGYALLSFSSLQDMFGKFMAGFDVESIWANFFSKIAGADENTTLSNAEISINDDDLKSNSLAKLSLSARDINAVGCSSYIISEAIIESKRINDIAKRKAEIQSALFPELNAAFFHYLNWQKNAITTYAVAMKIYYSSELTTEDRNYGFDYQNVLWPLYVGDYMVSYLSTLSWKGNMRKKIAAIRKRSALSGILLIASYAVTGAYIGGSIGGGYGAIIGAVVGAIIGAAAWILE